jgi:hypothetical protein
MTKMKPLLKSMLGAVALTSSFAWAGGHYGPGNEGVAAASAPPPGTYYLGYLVNYKANSLQGAPGNNSLNVTVLANRFAWISNTKVLGADYGAEVIVPVYGEIKASLTGIGHASNSDRGVGDVYVGPLILSWHGSNWDAVGAAGVWVDSGHYDGTNDASVGKGFKSNMYTFGGVYHFDDKKTWSLSVLNRYETNGSISSGPRSGYKAGDGFTTEWGVGKNFGGYTLGVVGYQQKQLSDDSGPTSTTNRASKTGIGMEYSTPLQSLGVMMKAAYYTESSTNDLKGNTLRFTFIKPL